MDNNITKIKFSHWTPWKDRNDLINIKYPGIYILAKFKFDLSKKVDLKDESIIYIGETCSSLKKRLRQFNRSAFQGARGHSGGISYREKYYDKGEDLFISIYPVENLHKDIRHLYIRYFERKIILDYALKNGKQPILNKK